MARATKWEQVEGHPDCELWRLRVPGGWLVRTSSYEGLSADMHASVSVAVALCFYPDPGHAWDLT